MSSEIKILRTTRWYWGAGSGAIVSGLSGQITHCEINGLEFYTRENANAISSFEISSGERWGDRIGKQPRACRQSLELAAPAGHFDELKALVQQVDTLKRPVLFNAAFTLETAQKYFKTQNYHDETEQSRTATSQGHAGAVQQRTAPGPQQL